MSNKQGKLIIFSAPSGCGKDTLLRELFNRDTNGEFALSRSMTTRSPRNEEKDGVDYYFVSRDYFEDLISQDKLIEFAEYNGNYYGTPKEPVEQWLKEGKTVFLEIEVQGAEKVRRTRPDAASIFILPPSIEELERRLRERKTDSPETIEKRIALAPLEIAKSSDFDYRIVNDVLERAAEELYQTVKIIKETE